MKQQGVLAGGMVAFALLCAFSAWWIGPVAASRNMPADVPADLPAAATPSAPPGAEPVASPTPAAPLAPAVAQKAAPTPSPTPTPVAVPSAAPLPATPSLAAAPAAVAVAAPAANSARQLEADIAKQLQGKIIEFESKSDQLTPRGKEVLDGLLPLFAKDPATRFVIEGHTDSWGEPAYNQALSERRARSVQAYLVSKGLEAKRFDAKGLGDARPIADNKTSAGSRKNRRIEFKAL
jgi:outer membrane protein OmpA-like peptidoglycan-associated protein